MSLNHGHVAINVTDLARSREFYADVLDLEIVDVSTTSNRRYAFLGWRGGVDVTLWEQADRPFDATVAGLHHVAFRATDRASLDGIEGRLRERGVAIRADGPLAHREGVGSGGLFFDDPDGTRLEVFVADGAETFAPPDDGPACGFF